MSESNEAKQSAPSPVLERQAAASRYRVLGTLGEGGMGVVYRVHDVHKDRVIALKRMTEREGQAGERGQRAASHSGSLQAQATARFRREFHTLAQLAHPNIIEVYDYGIDEFGPYYTMELLEGEDLRARAPLPWQEACALLRDVAAALALLHSRRLLHRDISPRNVYCTGNGRAKLIDFGAMSPMGFERALAGTPPFVPPETVARQALDGRADIYALGALAYYLLTGRNAYPARSIGQLRDVWRAQPRLPSAHARDVPEAVDALVMRMLSLDPQGRPGSAVELVERLTALAGLEHDDARYATAVKAYLNAPTLVGRSKALLGVRRRTLRALRGHGASLFVTGASGIGRSRFLDACALEGKLAGAIVVRVGRGDASSEFGATRALFEQLPEQLSETERKDFPSGALARSNPRRAPRASTIPPRAISDEGSERGAIQTELFAYLTGLASRRLLAIIADDVEDFDEPSLALLASLAQVVRQHKLVMICAHASDETARALEPLRALSAGSRAVALAPLDEAEVEALVRSVFGAIPNVTLLAARIYGLSAGLPRLCMDLCQHLLDCGAIQSRAGGFALQDSFSLADLPDSFRDALRLRVAGLSPDARLLGAALVLAGSAVLSVDECIELEPNSDAARVYRALTELQRMQIVTPEAYGVRLAKGYDDAFLLSLSDAHRVQLSARLAALFSRETRDRVRAAKHHFAAGQPQLALESLIEFAHDEAAIRYWFSENRSVLEQGLAACAQLKVPPRDVFFLRRALARALTFYIEPADREQLLLFADELYELAGGGFFAQLDEHSDPKQKLELALKLAFERYQQIPEPERILNPFEAVTMLGTYVAGLGAYATYTLDVDLLLRVPSLARLTPLSPSLLLVEKLLGAIRDMRFDRTQRGLAALAENIVALAAPDGAGFTAATRESITAHMLAGLGMLEAATGKASAWERARLLEGFPDHRVNAWRIRHLIHLYRPNARKAEECRHEVELLRLQEGPRQFGEGSTLEAELLAYTRGEDLLGLVRIKPLIEERAARYPGWIPWLRLVEAEFERMRHRPERAIELHAQALALAEPGKSAAWSHAAAGQLDALVLAGRAEEAKALGQGWFATAKTLDLDMAALIGCGLALAHAALAEFDAARGLIRECLDAPIWHLVSGLYYGSVLESAARVAIDAGDAEGFHDYFGRCWQEWGAGAYPPLAARLEKLMTAARRKKLAGTVQDEQSPSRMTAERVRDELARSTTQSERATRALELLIESAQATAGVLYGIRGADLELLAAHTTQAPGAALEDMLRRFLRAESDEERTLGIDEIANMRPSLRVMSRVEADGLHYFPFLLASGKGARAIAAGVVALAFADGEQCGVPPAVAAAVGDELIAAQDVTGLTLSR